VREAVTADDLMEKFGYTYSGAHSRLSQLSKQGFIQQVTKGRWCLTEKGYNKLDYHGVLKRKEDEQERIKRQAEGRVWYIDNGRLRIAKNVSEMLLTFDEAMRAVRKLKKEGFL
jgi:predicted transcriptional regulator